MSHRVLVLGDYRQTVTVVRSLARAGYEVTLGCADPDSSTAHSRYVTRAWIHDDSSAERYCEQLEAYLRSDAHDFVFVVGEGPLRRVITAGARLEPLALWCNPEPATVARCFDKSALYELAPRLGIPSLPWRRFSDVDEWRTSARDMGFPVVIKRKDSSGHVHGRKALILRTKEELERFLATLMREPDPGQLVLQKYLPGVRHNCHVACADGRIIAYFQQKVLSTDQLDDTGIGTAGMSVAPDPRMRAHCEKLTRALDYTGIGCIQFLVDERTGALGFLEFNARMDSTAALPYRLGYDFPLLAIALARYRRSRQDPPAGLTQAYAAGRTYHWLQGDLAAWLGAARARRMGRGGLAAWALKMAWMSLRSHHLTFDWRDPLPTLHMHWKRFARPVARRMQIGARTTRAMLSARGRSLL